jgi:hypothetical protein
MSTPTPTPSAPVVAEQHRIEHLVAGLRFGESTVINGTPVTAINVEVADLLARHRWASARYRALAERGDYEGCEYVRDEMAMCRCQLAAAGMLHLVEVVS